MDKAGNCAKNIAAYTIQAPSLHYCQEFFGTDANKVQCKELSKNMARYILGVRKNCVIGSGSVGNGDRAIKKK